ncbi:hypothetical protein D3C80_1444780 [compost metagenome]
MGAAGIDDDCRLRVAAGVQQVAQLALGLLQTAGDDIASEHGGRQFEHHHQRIGALLGALFHLLPTGAEQGQHAEQPGQAQGQPGQSIVALASAAEQPGLEGAGQQLLPATAAPLAMPEQPEQPGHQGQQQQPGGA